MALPHPTTKAPSRTDVGKNHVVITQKGVVDPADPYLNGEGEEIDAFPVVSSGRSWVWAKMPNKPARFPLLISCFCGPRSISGQFGQRSGRDPLVFKTGNRGWKCVQIGLRKTFLLRYLNLSLASATNNIEK